VSRKKWGRFGRFGRFQEKGANKRKFEKETKKDEVVLSSSILEFWAKEQRLSIFT
jgi:hypothetical protein